jgi:hypothetical protein
MEGAGEDAQNELNGACGSNALDPSCPEDRVD